MENYYFDSTRKYQGKAYRTYRSLREKRVEATSRRPSQDGQGRKLSDAAFCNLVVMKQLLICFSALPGKEEGGGGSPNNRGSVEGPSWKSKIGKFTRNVKQDDVYQELVESNISSEASMILLDTIELFISAFRV